MYAGVDERRIVTGLGAEEAVDDVDDEDAYAEANHASHSCQHKALAHDLRDDVAWAGTDGAPHSDLSRAFLDRHHHNVTDADHAGQQRAHAHEPDQRVDTGEEHGERGELFGEVDHHHGLLVGRGDAVLPAENAGDVVDDALYGYVFIGGGGQEVDHVALVQRLLHGGEGQEDALLRPSSDVHPCPFTYHADDLIVDAVDADVPAAGVLVAEEGLVDARADEAYFAFFAGIDLVE